MVKSATSCMVKARSTDGHGHFEWPRKARGWKRRPVVQMLTTLGMTLAHFDGCSFGVRASASVLARTPWTVATTHLRLAATLRQYICLGDHPHGVLSGSWATRSGFYPDSLCTLELDTLDVSDLDTPPPVRPVRHGLRVHTRQVIGRERLLRMRSGSGMGEPADRGRSPGGLCMLPWRLCKSHG